MTSPLHAADRPRRSCRDARLSPRRRPEGHPQLRGRRLSRRMRASRRAEDRRRRSRSAAAQLIGFPGCYPSAYAHRVIEAICTHPNVGAVLLVSLGCEEFRRSALREAVAKSGRPVELLVIQDEGGTTATIDAGRAWVEARLAEAAAAPTVPARLLRPRHRHQVRRLRRALAASPPIPPSARLRPARSMPARR